MKVKELIESLNKLDPEAEVLNYVEEAEEYGNTSSIKVINSQDEMPYSKGDTPEFKGNLVLISGWIA